jgi:hypothetical protein
VPPKRRLPVLQSKDENDSPPRPRWEWIGFGAVVMVVVWLPLAGLAALLVGRLSAPAPSSPTAIAALPATSILLACLFGGYLLGRWGKRGRLDGGLAAGFAMLFGIGLSWARFGVTWEGLFALVLAVPSGVLGATLGRRRRGGVV